MRILSILFTALWVLSSSYNLACLAQETGRTSNSNDLIWRVDPPNWFTGMEHEMLELMIHGDKVAQYEVQINGTSEVRLNHMTKTQNPNYLFLNLGIDESFQGDKIDLHFSKDGETEIIEYKFRAKNDKVKNGLDGSDVMYLIMPDRFANGDEETDNTDDTKEQADREDVHGKHGGDLQGIIDHLDYIEDLGVTTIWLNPVYENNMEHSSYHGYSITDHYRVDPRLGSMDTYMEFVSECHNKGLKVVKDMIFNHIGSFHWWIEDLPTPDWINNWPEFRRSNYSAQAVSDPYVPESDRNLLVDGWFDVTMPDLDQSDPLLLNYLIQQSIWWIEMTDIDGIRMDTYPYPDKNAMAKWCDRIYMEYPDFYLVGETWLYTTAQIAYWTENNLMSDYRSPLKSASDFPVCFALERCFRDGKGVWELYSVLTNDFLYKNPNNHKIFADNHDMDRIMYRVGERLDNFKLAMTFILTTRGIPQVLYGTEIGMKGHGPHGVIREDMPGGWSGDEYDVFNGKNLDEDQLELHHFMKRLLNWRKTKTLFQENNLIHYVPKDEIYVYGRKNEDEAILVILNNSERIEEEFKFEPYAELLEGYTSGREILSGNYLELISHVRVPSKTALIIDLIK